MSRKHKKVQNKLYAIQNKTSFLYWKSWNAPISVDTTTIKKKKKRTKKKYKEQNLCRKQKG